MLSGKLNIIFVFPCHESCKNYLLSPPVFLWSIFLNCDLLSGAVFATLSSLFISTVLKAVFIFTRLHENTTDLNRFYSVIFRVVWFQFLLNITLHSTVQWEERILLVNCFPVPVLAQSLNIGNFFVRCSDLSFRFQKLINDSQQMGRLRVRF